MSSSGDKDAHRVTDDFTCADFPDELQMHAFEATEELNRPYVVSIQVEARYENTELVAPGTGFSGPLIYPFVPRVELAWESRTQPSTLPFRGNP